MRIRDSKSFPPSSTVLKTYTLVLAPLVHALILRAVHTVKEVGKPPFVPVLRDTEVPESEKGL